MSNSFFRSNVLLNIECPFINCGPTDRALEEKDKNKEIIESER